MNRAAHTDAHTARHAAGPEPSAEEIAAVTAAILLALTAAAPAPRVAAAPSGWSRRARFTRTPARPGPGVWQAAARQS